MKRMSLLCSIVPFVLIGCSAQIENTRVPLSKLKDNLPEPGIYYTLPKTQVSIEAPIIVKTTMYGALGKSFKENLAACQINLSHNFLTRETTDYTFYFSPPAVSTKALADQNHLYRLEVGMDTFSAFSHTLSMSPEGFLISADSTMENPAVELAHQIISTASSIFAAKAKARSGASNGCRLLLGFHSDITTHEAQLNILLQPIQLQRTSLLLDKGLKADIEVLKFALSHLDDKETQIKKAFKAQHPRYQAALKAVGHSSSYKAYVLQRSILPDEFTDVALTTGTWEVNSIVPPTAEEQKYLSIGRTVNTLENPNLAQKSLREQIPDLLELKVGITQNPKTVSSKKHTDIPASNKGYRYRVPSPATLKLTFGDNVWASSQVSIAQYGPIATLPARVGGIKGNVNLKINAATGGASSVTVGATPVPADTIGKFGALVTDQIEQRKAEEKEKENAELNALNQENAVLEARKKNRELKSELGLDQP